MQERPSQVRFLITCRRRRVGEVEQRCQERAPLVPLVVDVPGRGLVERGANVEGVVVGEIVRERWTSRRRDGIGEVFLILPRLGDPVASRGQLWGHLSWNSLSLELTSHFLTPTNWTELDSFIGTTRNSVGTLSQFECNASKAKSNNHEVSLRWVRAKHPSPRENSNWCRQKLRKTETEVGEERKSCERWRQAKPT